MYHSLNVDIFRIIQKAIYKKSQSDGRKRVADNVQQDFQQSFDNFFFIIYRP